MADQRPWWKLWVSALTDADLEALSLEDWARWARLCTYIKMHGEGGRLVVRYPAAALSDLFRYTSGGRPWGGPHGSRQALWEHLLTTLQRLPGVLVELAHGAPPLPLREASGTPSATSPVPPPLPLREGAPLPLRQSYTGTVRPPAAQAPDKTPLRQCGAHCVVIITIKNWQKYQEDSSAERTRRWREKQRQRDGQLTSHGDAERPSHRAHGDASSASRGDGVEEKRSRRDPPKVPSSPSSRERSTPPLRDGFPFFDWTPESSAAHAQGDGWLPGRLPFDAFHHDCPEPPWRGQCVRSDYAAQHPGAFPATGIGEPKQCPAHREARPAW